MPEDLLLSCHVSGFLSPGIRPTGDNNWPLETSGNNPTPEAAGQESRLFSEFFIRAAFRDFLFFSFFLFSSVINRRTRLAIFQLHSVDISGARLNLARFPIGALGLAVWVTELKRRMNKIAESFFSFFCSLRLIIPFLFSRVSFKIFQESPS